MSEEYAGLNLVDLLGLLEPIPEPEPVSMLPQTIGWIWVAVAFSALALWGLRRAVFRWRSNAYRRAALREITSVAGNHDELPAILRRTALAAYPREKVAALHGEDWLAFLDRTYGGDEFTKGAGRPITRLPYANTADANGLFPVVIRWVKQHKAVLPGKEGGAS
ncbi:DUF4381 domain-containing protein [Roseibium sp.]|uniref:DUF4381 domain-containing protein n=1 Tax=Roseibium sp. TaxID=1936156 RepID=UPI003A970134